MEISNQLSIYSDLLEALYQKSNQTISIFYIFNSTQMMLNRLRMFYNVRKPRILSQNAKSFLEYTHNLRHARRQVHLEDKNYQNQIEDQYLQHHHEDIKKRHFQNQCTFRKQVFTNAYRVFQNQAQWKLKDEMFNSRLNKRLHEEDVRKINRSRILKIMQHQSNNYWFNPENVETRLREETIFPEYIASTEYYYRLFAEALAYELGDFEELHHVTSNEEIIKEKNKLLIPLFLNLRSQVSTYKRNQAKEEVQRSSFELQRLKNSNQFNEAQMKDIAEKEKIKTEAKIRQVNAAYQTPQGKLNIFKKKVKDLVCIFKTWKEYTNILGLTSAQIIKNQYDIKAEISINKKQKQILNNLKTKQKEAFIGSIEEDTEEIEISFEDYLNKINQQRKETQVSSTESVSIDELNDLLKSTEQIQTKHANIDLNASKVLDLGNLLKSAAAETVVETSSGLATEVNPQYLNIKQTTSSVEILKQHFRDDHQFINLLNQLGEIDVRYPKLFETIWSSIHI